MRTNPEHYACCVKILDEVNGSQPHPYYVRLSPSEEFNVN